MPSATKTASYGRVSNRIRKLLRKAGEDPLGDEDSDELTKTDLDELLLRENRRRQGSCTLP